MPGTVVQCTKKATFESVGTGSSETSNPADSALSETRDCNARTLTLYSEAALLLNAAALVPATSRIGVAFAPVGTV